MSDKETKATGASSPTVDPCPERFLHSHKAGGSVGHSRVFIGVIDEPGFGGACHEYSVRLGPHNADAREAIEVARIKFQKGPIAEAGLNGLTMESLLAIVIDRLQGFQAGDYSCQENALALARAQEAMHWLHQRTIRRMERGVEGTNTN